MGKIKQFVAATESLLGDKALMHVGVKEMSVEDLTAAFLVLDGLLKDKGAVALRLAEVKTRLKEIVTEKGKVENKEAGHKVLQVGDVTLTNQRRPASMPEEKGLKALIEKTKGLSLKDVVTVIKTVKVDPSKVKALIDLGKLDEKKVEKLRKVTWALVVKATEGSHQLLDDYGLVPTKKK